MAERGQLDELWRRGVDANLRFYEGVGRLTADYVRALASVAADLRTGRAARPSAPSAADPAPPREAPPRPPAERQDPVLVLEAEAGNAALGVFMVENLLGSKVSAPVTTTPFADSEGREVQPDLSFDPDVITLEPGEQMLVRVAAAIDEAFEPDVAYRGEVSVPGPVGTRVPLVLRRRPEASKPRTRARRKATARSSKKRT